MKKIICLLLVLACSFAMFACGKEEELTGAQKTAQFYENSLPTKVVTTSTQSIINDSGVAVQTLNGKYELVTGTIAGKLATVQTYEQDYILEVAEGANTEIVGPIGTKKGSLEYLEDYGRRTNGGAWDAKGLNFGPTAGSIAINLDESLLTGAQYTEGEDGINTLTFTVANENIAAVFGADSDDVALLTASSDVEVTITNNGAFVKSIAISYTIAGTRYYPERRVVMTTEYEYDVQNVELAH